MSPYSQSLDSYWEHSKQVHRRFQWWSSGDFLRYSDSAWNIRTCDLTYTIPAGESLPYGYYRVDACPQQPILIRYESIKPSRSTADDYFVSNNCLYTRSLGTGFEIAIFRFEPNYNGNPQLIHSRFYATLFLPNPPLSWGLIRLSV